MLSAASVCRGSKRADGGAGGRSLRCAERLPRLGEQPKETWGPAAAASSSQRKRDLASTRGITGVLWGCAGKPWVPWVLCVPGPRSQTCARGVWLRPPIRQAQFDRGFAPALPQSQLSPASPRAARVRWGKGSGPR